MNYDEVTQGRTDDNNSTDDNELSYSLKLISDLEKIRIHLYIITQISNELQRHTQMLQRIIMDIEIL